MADDPEQTTDEHPALGAQETAVGHSVVDPASAAGPDEPVAAAEAPVEQAPVEEAPTAPQAFTPSYSPPSSSSGPSPAEADRAGAELADGGGRPEIAAAGAFIGAFAFAKLLKRFGGDD
jgi:hypothetical protein